MAGQLTIDTLKASSGVLATQNGMTGIAKAWVNFNGSAATVTTSFNVSSVTKTATGQYTISITTAMPSANYCITSTGSIAGNATAAFLSPRGSGATITSSSFMLTGSNGVNTTVDVSTGYAAVFSS